ncbi:hypothetical protein G7K_1954-t1 [Saitoella complicata NRRL Y-17804]|uniref:Uncharacterized protein n=1 Tax=Saitoella complicata (strain BCRC 22490 / CBS 7301 / JCM 7358 / NBRC 10748 / NRRL Y-17804) TaxID=698492 RepID=A0A0E9NEB5_SAICN|nr:hypothetical protein G7K_1954-t1 [Saitoella complicata NRRL Y-17804]
MSAAACAENPSEHNSSSQPNRGARTRVPSKFLVSQAKKRWLVIKPRRRRARFCLITLRGITLKSLLRFLISSSSDQNVRYPRSSPR